MKHLPRFLQWFVVASWGMGLAPIAGIGSPRLLASDSPTAKPHGTSDPAWEALAPLFSARCNSCHQSSKKRGGLTLESPEGFHAGGDSGPAAAEILKRVALPADAEGAMPPKGDRLKASELAILREQLARVRPPAALETHWSLKVPVRPAVPQSGPAALSPIDRFLQAKLAEAGLKPNPETDKRTLLRRLKFDLVGLPPTSAEIESFLADRSSDAYEKKVNEYLSSPQFGERWARHWLDAVRFAESDGFETNQPRPNAWVYRDWVIRAFQNDMPYDRFLTAQLAGDQIGESAGTGFLVGGPYDRVKSPDETLIRQQRADELHDMVSTASSAFLGLTGGCARCHSHKFDPISHEDYYRLKAIFEGVIHGERPLQPDPARAREAELAKVELQKLEGELASQERQAQNRLTRWIYPAKTATAEFVPLVAPLGVEPYAAGNSAGQKSYAGTLTEFPTLGTGYAYWNRVKDQPLALYKPGLSGSFRVGYSWGAGWSTHTTKARLVLDRDGRTETTADQVLLATIDQQKRVRDSSPTPNQPLWSGLADFGVVTLTNESALILYAGPDDAYATADLLVLQESGAPDETIALRAPVSTGENRERFAAVKVDRLRIRIAAANQSEPCLDEVELFSATEPGVNLAKRECRVVASSSYQGNAFHKLEHINDGIYGNQKSWIAGSTQQAWIEFRFPAPITVDEVRWSRDRTVPAQYADRVMTDYAIAVANGNDDWTIVAGSNDRVPMGTLSGPALRFGAAGKSDEPLLQKTKKLAELRDRATVLSSQSMGYLGQFQQPGATQLFHRGDPMEPRQRIAPGGFSKIGGSLDLPAETAEAQRRLALAKWMTAKENPLPARVIVNRLWQHHFGVGIVSTSSDFGRNGARPTHPELLDWLACELIEPTMLRPQESQAVAWSLKHIHRLIVLSAAYRQSSAANALALERDAQSRLLWRYPSRRLEAESIRDAILFVSGNLSLEQGGPGFDLFETNTNYVKVYTNRAQFGPAEWRRMVYQNKPRMRLDNIFGVFDCPDAGQIAPMRNRSTTPLQSLALLNSPFMLDQAGRFAARIEKEFSGDARRKVQGAFVLALQRNPEKDEESAAVALVEKGGLVSLCRALLSSNEFLYPD